MEQRTLTINGCEQKTLARTVAELVAGLNISTDHIAIAVNNTVVPTGAHASTPLKSGDSLEIIRPVCGG